MDFVALFNNILNYSLGNNTRDFLIALLVFFVSIIVLNLFRKWGVWTLKKIADYTKNKYDNFLADAIQKVGWPFYIIFSLFVAAQFLNLDPQFTKYFYLFVFLVFFYYALHILQTVVDFWFFRIKERADEGDEDYVQLGKFVRALFKWVLWFIAILLILQYFGIKISAILTGLGVGSVVIAFALQNILLDIFSFVSIYLDQPFVVGDFIVVADESGAVKKIGIRSTRIISLKGEEMIISNRKLLDNIIHNYKKTIKRRKTFDLYLAEETSGEKLREMLDAIKNIIKAEDSAEFERAHFSDIKDQAYVFEVVYFVNSNDYNKYMDVQQNINFKIKEALDIMGVKLAKS